MNISRSAALGGTRRNILEPADRIAEVMFGLIMALTVTGALSISDAGRNDVRAMLIGALGCNLAWGLIDAHSGRIEVESDAGQGSLFRIILPAEESGT